MRTDTHLQPVPHVHTLTHSFVHFPLVFLSCFLRPPVLSFPYFHFLSFLPPPFSLSLVFWDFLTFLPLLLVFYVLFHPTYCTSPVRIFVFWGSSSSLLLANLSFRSVLQRMPADLKLIPNKQEKNQNTTHMHTRLLPALAFPKANYLHLYYTFRSQVIILPTSYCHLNMI